MEQALRVLAECIALVVESIAIGVVASTDFARSAIPPPWAIAAIGTFLSYFLEKDIEDARPAPGRERIEA
jgi:hypothetical protein